LEETKFKREYEYSTRKELLEKLKNQGEQDPENILRSLETFCEIIINSILSENE
jgi:phage regulator Rha-like protein